MSPSFSISDLCLFTGLTDRTIRTYLANGILQGEMIDRAWTFTEEQVQALCSTPAFRPAYRPEKMR